MSATSSSSFLFIHAPVTIRQKLQWRDFVEIYNTPYSLILLLLSSAAVDVDRDGQERQANARLRIQECACPRCEYSYSSDYDCDYEEYLRDYDCEEEGESAHIDEDYEHRQSKISNKRNQKTSNHKELRKIKVAGKNSSKNPRSCFAKQAVAAKKSRNLHTSSTILWEPRLAGRLSGRRNQQWTRQSRHQLELHEQQPSCRPNSCSVSSPEKMISTPCIGASWKLSTEV
jgi:hypothetical protein